MRYDFLLVGAGLFSGVIAERAQRHGKSCLVIEKRNHIGGNIYTESVAGINVHRYGAHVFHTDDEACWTYINRFADFNRYTHSPVANCSGAMYNLPFNMNTFHKMWPDVITPEQAESRIRRQAGEIAGRTPRNLEEQAISLVGRDIYEKLVRSYSEKQWGRKCTELPPHIIMRLPVRFTYDNNYFSDRYQGIPIGGYTQIVEKMLAGCDVRLETDYFADRAFFDSCADQIVFTGTIDKYYEYRWGELEYRSLRFAAEVLPIPNFQGNAVVNYTDAETPYTRIIEHKHFECAASPATAITREYPQTWHRGDEPYYAVNDARNNAIYAKYKALADSDERVVFGGRLGSYKYYDMDDTVIAALALARKLF